MDNQSIKQNLDTELMKVLKTFRQFESKKQMIPYYVEYEYESQKDILVQFWNNVIQELMIKYFQSSIIEKQKLIDVVTFDRFKPICLSRIIDIMVIEKQDYLDIDDRQQLVDLVDNHNHTTNNQSIWSSVSTYFTNYFTNPKVKETKQFILIEYFQKKLRKCIERVKRIKREGEIQIYQQNELLDILGKNQMREESILMIDVMVELDMIYKNEQNKRVKYIICEERFNDQEIDKQIYLYEINQQLQWMDQQMDDLYQQKNKVDQQIKLYLNQSQKEKAKTLVNLIKTIQNKLNLISERKMTIQEIILKVENGIINQQVFEALKSSNTMQQKIQIDLDELQHQQQNYQWNIDQVKQVDNVLQQINTTNQNEVDQQYSKYMEYNQQQSKQTNHNEQQIISNHDIIQPKQNKERINQYV